MDKVHVTTNNDCYYNQNREKLDTNDIRGLIYLKHGTTDIYVGIGIAQAVCKLAYESIARARLADDSKVWETYLVANDDNGQIIAVKRLIGTPTLIIQESSIFNVGFNCMIYMKMSTGEYFVRTVNDFFSNIDGSNEIGELRKFKEVEILPL
jgi:hypothetical protein